MRSLLGLTVTAIATTIVTVIADGEHRAKRSYYGYDYGYGVDGDFWYAGRILGIILGVSLLLVCCCIPCVCLAGIWFLGWFGLRQRRQRKTTTNPNTNNGNQASSSASRPVIRHPIRVHDSPPPRRNRSFSEDAGDNIIYSAEDRYYSSSAPSGNRRPDIYRASQF